MGCGCAASGAMDALSLNVANQLLGNPFNTAGLECTLQRAKLKFHCDSQIALTGGDIQATLDGIDVPMWTSINVRKGQVLKCGRIIKDVAAISTFKNGLKLAVFRQPSHLYFGTVWWICRT